VQTLLTVTLPVFALIFCGYAAGRLQLMAEPAVAGLNRFVFYFALPALLFVKLATPALVATFDPRFVAAYLMAELAVFLTAAAVGQLLFRRRPGELALQGFAATFSNTGYIGLPLAIFALGDAAAILLVVVIAIDITLMMPLTIVIIETERRQERRPAALTARLAGSLARNPLVLAIGAGGLAGGLVLPLPPPVETFVTLLGAAAGPCALFAVGATLAGRAARGGVAEVAHMTTFKLLGLPLAVWATTTWLFPLDPLGRAAALLAAALPTASNVYIVAQHYGIYVDRTSTTVLVSTALALVTVSVLLALLTGP
jgi:malonate transporter and related proteins